MPESATWPLHNPYSMFKDVLISDNFSGPEAHLNEERKHPVEKQEAFCKSQEEAFKVRCYDQAACDQIWQNFAIFAKISKSLEIF